MCLEGSYILLAKKATIQNNQNKKTYRPSQKLSLICLFIYIFLLFIFINKLDVCVCVYSHANYSYFLFHFLSTSLLFVTPLNIIYKTTIFVYNFIKSCFTSIVIMNLFTFFYKSKLFKFNKNS